MHLLDEDLGKVWKDDERVQFEPRRKGKLEKTFNPSVYHLFDQQGCVRTNVLPFCAISFATYLESTVEWPVKLDEKQNTHRLSCSRLKGA